MFPSLYFDCQLARVVTREIDVQYADPREKEKDKEWEREERRKRESAEG